MTNAKRNKYTLTDYLPLAGSMAEWYAKKNMYADKEELYACALLGLCEADKKYDPNSQMAFPTYARWHIQKQITHYLSRNTSTGARIPASIYHKVKPSDRDQLNKHFYTSDIQQTHIEDDTIHLYDGCMSDHIHQLDPSDQHAALVLVSVAQNDLITGDNLLRAAAKISNTPVPQMRIIATTLCSIIKQAGRIRQ